MHRVFIISTSLAFLCLQLGCWQSFHEPKIDAIKMNATPSNQWEQDLDALLKTHVNDKGLVDYATLLTKKERVESIIAALQFVKIDASWTEHQKLAFWINAYNVLMFWNILSKYPQVYKDKNVLDFKTPFFETNKFSIANIPVTLNDIENKIIRNKDAPPEWTEKKLTIETLRPELHTALSCAALSCPPLRNALWKADSLDQDLKTQMRKVLNNDAFLSLGKDGKPNVTSLVDWYNEDFKADGKTVGAYLASWLDDAKKELKTALTAAGNDKSKLSFKTYDWTLNHQ